MDHPRAARVLRAILQQKPRQGAPSCQAGRAFQRARPAFTSAPFVAVAAVVVLAAVTGITLTALASTANPQHKQAQTHSEVTFTTSSTLPRSGSGKPSVGPNTTTSNNGKGTSTPPQHGAVSTTAPFHGTTATTVPPNSSAQTNASSTGSTVTTQTTSTNGAVAPVCPLGASRSVAMAVTSDGGGYWVTQSNGDVIAYGDAAQYPASTADSAPMSSVSTIPGSSGYVLLANDGAVDGVGAAAEGSATSVGSACDAVAIAATPDGHGYWVALSTGGVLSLGDAALRGNASGSGTSVVDMAVTADGGGYWLVASDGGIFNYGDAQFYGSASSLSERPHSGDGSYPGREGLLAGGFRWQRLLLRRCELLRQPSPLVFSDRCCERRRQWHGLLDPRS